MKTRPVFLLLLIVLLGPSFAFAESCACKKKPSLKQAVRESSVILTGKVQEQSLFLLTPKIGYQKSRIRISENLRSKYKLGSSIFVYSPIAEHDCSYSLDKNAEYLIYASGPLKFLRISSCTRTNPLDKATGDIRRLKYLRKGKKR